MTAGITTVLWKKYDFTRDTYTNNLSIVFAYYPHTSSNATNLKYCVLSSKLDLDWTTASITQITNVIPK